MISVFVSEVAGWLDMLLYTGVVYLATYLPYQVESVVLKNLFVVETSGLQEKSECVFLLSHDTRVSRRLLFSEKRKYVTSSAEQAVAWSTELGLPIQTVMCHHSMDYFQAGWVRPQPYCLVYQYGAVNESRTIGEYYLELLHPRDGYRVHTPQHNEDAAVLVAALLCSRHPVVMLYLLLRYQWYQGHCFGGLLAGAIAYEIGTSFF